LDARWSDFDLERRNWRIPISKNGKARNVPLSSAVLEILASLPRFENCPYVVPNPKTKKPFVSFYASWDAARKRAGLSDVTVHMLRHTGASQLLKAGASIYTVSRILGHANLRTTQRYAHLSDDALLAAVDAQASVIGASWTEPQRQST
jgi:integrase